MCCNYLANLAWRGLFTLADVYLLGDRAFSSTAFSSSSDIDGRVNAGCPSNSC